MSIAVDTYCFQCYLRRNVDLARSLGSEAKATEFAKKLMRFYLDAPAEASAPWFGPQVSDLLHEMYGLEIDRYRDEKIQSNRFAVERMEEVRARIAEAEDPIYAGLQFAVLGNYLDYSALQGNVSFDKLEDMLAKAKEFDLSGPNFEALRADLARGRRLLYLTDNAGEIGFDRVFAETIRKQYPQLDITFCVRGDVTQNDATREDARAVGLPFKVIDNGNRVAGTEIGLLSAEARQALEDADVILAKGMGNTETMYGCGYNVYYAFLVKCPRFEYLFEKPMFTPMLVRDQDKKK